MDDKEKNDVGATLFALFAVIVFALVVFFTIFFCVAITGGW